MSKITTPLLVEDFYRTKLSLDVNPTWDIELTVTAPPANTKGFIIVDPESEANRERMYYHNVIGNIIYVKWVNRVNPKEHFAQDNVQINDTSLIFNYLSRLQSTTFYVEQLTALGINVWWGPVLKWIETVSVADTPLTVTDAATNYIYYKGSTNEIKSAIAEATVTTDKWIIVADVVAASWSITSISYRKNWLTTWISIDTVTLTWTVGLVDTYTILFTDGTSSTFNVTNWSNIASIDYTSSVLNVDTYTVTLTNWGTTTFEVTNGTSIASIAKTWTVGLVDTYTITLTDGDTSNTFEVTNWTDWAWVPAWWTTSEILIKKSNTDNDTEWSLKYNLSAIVAPTATDDSVAWYSVWSEWIDITADTSYKCVDATVAAAIWVSTSWWWVAFSTLYLYS